jgi:hypothetical protein
VGLRGHLGYGSHGGQLWWARLLSGDVVGHAARWRERVSTGVVICPHERGVERSVFASLDLAEASGMLLVTPLLVTAVTALLLVTPHAGHAHQLCCGSYVVAVMLW